MGAVEVSKGLASVMVCHYLDNIKHRIPSYPELSCREAWESMFSRTFIVRAPFWILWTFSSMTIIRFEEYLCLHLHVQGNPDATTTRSLAGQYIEGRGQEPLRELATTGEARADRSHRCLRT